jgi:hypothetical protein
MNNNLVLESNSFALFNIRLLVMNLKLMVNEKKKNQKSISGSLNPQVKLPSVNLT